jgi:NADPH:quinone reductase-like Zn-dependent oxidoreductase
MGAPLPPPPFQKDAKTVPSDSPAQLPDRADFLPFWSSGGGHGPPTFALQFEARGSQRPHVAPRWPRGGNAKHSLQEAAFSNLTFPLPHAMRKVLYTQFGDEQVLTVHEQPTPTITQNQLLIQVKATSINPLDWKIYRGEMKLLSGSKLPKGVGIDFAGVVAQVGPGVTRFHVGDAVFGLLEVFKGGALADYVVVTEAALAPKPANISFDQAAALPVAGLSALQIIDQLAAVGPGHEVLLNGASGGVGMLALQLAKQRGARVTAVVGPAGVQRATQLGADAVIDYTKQDVRQLPQRFDTLIDLSDKLPFKAAKQLLKPRATYVNTLPSPQSLVLSFLHNIFSSRKRKILILKLTAAGLNTLATLAQNGLQIPVEQVYDLANVRRAYQEASRGKVKGKAVVVLN